jgi:flagellar protein FliS
MASQAKLDTYRDTSIVTENPAKLIVLLYDGAVKFLKLARAELAEGDFVQKGKFIARAQTIIAELNAALNMGEGGELARLLRALYQFMFQHLNEANMERSEEKLDRVIGMLEGLNSSWREVASRAAVAADA